VPAPAAVHGPRPAAAPSADSAASSQSPHTRSRAS
jgi:hypothetical protein